MNGRWKEPLRDAAAQAARPLVASALLFLSAHYLERVAAIEEQRASRAATAARLRVEGARAAETVLATHGRRYAELQRRGLIGEPDRLRFVESVQTAARELNLRNVSYELRPTSVAEGITTTPLQLRVGLTHEGELLQFFERLRRAPAAVWVRRCTLEPAGGVEAAALRDGDALDARCDIEFKTVRLRP